MVLYIKSLLCLNLSEFTLITILHTWEPGTAIVGTFCSHVRAKILSPTISKSINADFDYVINLSGQNFKNKIYLKKVIIQGNKNLIKIFSKTRTSR